MLRRFTVLVIAAAVLLSGCQLAVPEEQQPATAAMETGDRIIGMLVTLDSFEPGAAENSDALHLVSNQGKRIYAKLQEEPYESSDGTVRTTYHMAFPEDLGLTFMGYEITQEMLPTLQDGERYWTNTIDDGILLEKNNYKSVNKDSFVQLEAVVYVSDTASDLVLYMNPVYQNESGEVYALGVVPMGYHAVSMYDCAVSYGTTETGETNGETVDEESGYVKMTIRVVSLPDYYRIVQMSSENKVIKTEDIAPADLPEEYTPEADCAYLILEEYTQGQDVKRSVKNPEDQTMTLGALYPMENGICDYGHTLIKWEGAV